MFKKSVLGCFILMLVVAQVWANNLNSEQAPGRQYAKYGAVEPSAQFKTPGLYQDGKANLSEGFEGTTFPPAGWTTVNVAGTYVWVRDATLFHSGTASAFIDYETTGGNDWLITPPLFPNTSDSVVFWLRRQYSSAYPPDNMYIKVSTTDALPGSFGSAILSIDVANMAASTWVRYAAALGSYNGQRIYVAFHHQDTDGNGCWLDDVTGPGLNPAVNHNISVAAIDSPAVAAFIPAPFHPAATISNSGLSKESDFWTYYQIKDNGGIPVYLDSLKVISPDSINPAASRSLVFPSTFTPSAAPYTAIAWTALSGDEFPGDDTLRKSFAPTYRFWTSWADFPDAWSGASEIGLGSKLFVFGGKNLSATTPTNFITFYDTEAGTWTTSAATLNEVNYYSSAVAAQGKIFITGGSSAFVTGLTTTQAYFPNDDSIHQLAPMPTPALDHAMAVWRDSIIYRIGGGNWNPAPLAPVATVEMYDIASNTWTTATSLPVATGTPTAACLGDTIVVSTGYQGAAAVATTYIGVIDPSNPASITWTTGPAYPGGAVYRAQWATVNHELFVIGGQTGPLATTYSYNAGTNSWTQWPDKTTASANIRGGGIVGNWLVIAGGYDGGAYLTQTEALHLWWPSAGVEGQPVASVGGTRFQLMPGFPNPARTVATFSYQLPAASRVSLKIYNTAGQLVRTMTDAAQTAGIHNVTWNGRDNGGRSVASGVYLIRLNSGIRTATGKLVVIK